MEFLRQQLLHLLGLLDRESCSRNSVMMKRRLLLLLLLLPVVSLAQSRIQLVEPDANKVALLSRVVSIDRVDGELVTAYANEQELADLSRRGYSYKVCAVEASKAAMASSIEEMKQWNRYPTYDTYVALMQQYAQDFPSLCRLDTIGVSTGVSRNGTLDKHLILCMVIHPQGDTSERPQFFYSSTIHGDEVTGFYLMLRLIDTLLNGYETNPEYRQLIDDVEIFINPLANPDGTYYRSNSAISTYYSRRYNANSIDLNRNYPDPFGSAPLNPQQIENTDMISYFSNHNFRLSANLHGGAEVLNYPWDSFLSSQRTHPQRNWWVATCKGLADTIHALAPSHFIDVTTSGYINGGDWYVISNGRQDYVNHYHNCLELTIELSVDKILSTDLLQQYWGFMQRPLINYIKAIYNLPGGQEAGIDVLSSPRCFAVYPNPTNGRIVLETPKGEEHSPLYLMDIFGRIINIYPSDTKSVDLSCFADGLYLLKKGASISRVIKK